MADQADNQQAQLQQQQYQQAMANANFGQAQAGGGATTSMGMPNNGMFMGGSMPFGGGMSAMVPGFAGGFYDPSTGQPVQAGGYGMPMTGGGFGGGQMGGGGQQQSAQWSPGQGQITAQQVAQQYGADPSVAQYWADKINTGGDPNYYIGRLKQDNAGSGPDAPGGMDSGKGGGGGDSQQMGMPQMQLGGFGGSNLSFGSPASGMNRVQGYSGPSGGLGSYVQAAGGNLGGYAPSFGGSGSYGGGGYSPMGGYAPSFGAPSMSGMSPMPQSGGMSSGTSPSFQGFAGLMRGPGISPSGGGGTPMFQLQQPQQGG